ncbi:hypothetical protein NE237_005358 [Protea cynaroides]|uniref:Uncharacterized protein n=1 Tax=Protea cynaroides TaxID=273540 RepID=A0A9Q0KKP2_9MAGN|nr:hypothetical protein NE237_005358 [Protea cynaroides]
MSTGGYRPLMSGAGVLDGRKGYGRGSGANPNLMELEGNQNTRKPAVDLSSHQGLSVAVAQRRPRDGLSTTNVLERPVVDLGASFVQLGLDGRAQREGRHRLYKRSYRSVRKEVRVGLHQYKGFDGIPVCKTQWLFLCSAWGWKDRLPRLWEDC